MRGSGPDCGNVTTMTGAEVPQDPPPPGVDGALHQAVHHHQQGQLRDAEHLYRAILHVQPDHPDANHNLGVLAAQVGRFSAGLPHLKAALEADPTQSQYWLSYIDVLIQAGQTDVARQVMDQGRQRGLRGEAVDVLAGRLPGGAPVPRPSGPATRQTAGATPGQGTAASGDEIDALAALFSTGRYDDAATLARTLTERFPRDGTGWNGLGVALLHLGRNAAALEAMQRAAEL